MTRFADSRLGACQAITATGDYGEWVAADCHYVMDHGVAGCWMVFCPGRGFACVVQTRTGEVVDEIPEFVWQERVLPVYQATTWAGERVFDGTPYVAERALAAVARQVWGAFAGQVTTAESGNRTTLSELQSFCGEHCSRTRELWRLQEKLAGFDISPIPALLLAGHIYEIVNAGQPR